MSSISQYIKNKNLDCFSIDCNKYRLAINRPICCNWLHDIYPMFDGSCMEILYEIINFGYEPPELNKDIEFFIFELFSISDLRSAFERNEKYKTIVSLAKCAQASGIVPKDLTFKEYFKCLIRNFDQVKEYLQKVHECETELVDCSTIQQEIKINGLVGKIDFCSENTLYDVKCEKESDWSLQRWKAQLSLYNLVLKKKSLKIINLLTTTIYEFHSSDIPFDFFGDLENKEDFFNDL